MNEFTIAEVNRRRAESLIEELLPQFTSRDEAIQHLWYVNPNASDEIRLWSIAAAVWWLTHEVKP